MSDFHIENLRSEFIKQEVEDNKIAKKAEAAVVVAAGEAAMDGVVSTPDYLHLDLAERDPLSHEDFINLINGNSEKVKNLVQDAKAVQVELTVPDNQKDADEAWESITSRIATNAKTTKRWRKSPANTDASLPAEIVVGDYVEGASMLPTQLTAVRRADTMTAEGLATSEMTIYRGMPENIQAIFSTPQQ